MCGLAARNLRRDAANDRADLPFEFAHAGFVSVVVDHPHERVFLPFALLRFEPVLLQLSPNEIAARDFQFLPAGVAGERDQLHPIAHRFRHAFDVVGGRDKNNLRKIERHIEVAIDKGKILPRIEHLEQRARRIAAEVGPELVDLVQHHDRVACAGAAQFLNDAPRHRPDVGAAMPADLRLIANPAQTHAGRTFARGRRRSIARGSSCPRPAVRENKESVRAPAG